MAVFRELGLIETRVAYASGEVTRSIHVNNAESRVELTDSVRYREGLGEWDVFQSFKNWVMRSDASSLGVRVSRPIVPGAAGEDGAGGTGRKGGRL